MFFSPRVSQHPAQLGEGLRNLTNPMVVNFFCWPVQILVTELSDPVIGPTPFFPSGQNSEACLPADHLFPCLCHWRTSPLQQKSPKGRCGEAGFLTQLQNSKPFFDVLLFFFQDNQRLSAVTRGGRWRYFAGFHFNPAIWAELPRLDPFSCEIDMWNWWRFWLLTASVGCHV